MPYRICKILEIESGHMLSKHSGNCRFPHGHSRRVEVVLSADQLDADDMVCDFSLIKTTLGELMQRFDHAMCVNTADPEFEDLTRLYGDRVIAFEGEDPTTEVIARTIYEVVSRRLMTVGAEKCAADGAAWSVRLDRIRVWETSTSWAEYMPPADAAPG